MMRWVVIALVVIAVGSSCDEVARAPAAGSPPASYSLALSGNDSFRSAPITIPAGNYQAAWTVHAEGSHYLLIGLVHGADLQPQNERTWLINAEVPATSTGSAEFESAGGQFII